jgi:heptaprenyl diphosphate synthase
MSGSNPKPLILLAFLTATACSVYIVESLIMRMLPLPFIRLGLSNIVVMYLILRKHFWQAMVVNITKSCIGGLVTFTLITPATLLSICGGLTAIIAMWAAVNSRLGFGVFGVSICGAVAHNLAQLVLVHFLILPQAHVFVLTPILLSLALVSGIFTAWILLIVNSRLKHFELGENETPENKT